MLRSSALAALALGLALTAASPLTLSLFRRNDFDICPQVGTTVPVPDHNNFQLPLDGFRQSMCWPFCIGDQATCSTKTNICFDFVQYTLTFTYPAIPGYTYTETDIWLGLSAPTGPVTPQYTTGNGDCKISTDRSTVTCVIPYGDIVGGPTNSQCLAGMCPNGDSQGLFFFLQTNAQLTGPNGPVAGEGAQSCTDHPTCLSFVPYWELTYRCSYCQPSSSSSSSTTTSSSSSSTTSSSSSSTTSSSSSSTTSSSPPTPTSCEVGTAFGYGTDPQAKTLNSQSPLPNTCKRWGWYFTPTTDQLSKGISGPLYVGAGQNDISKGTLVGAWSANISGGKVYVTYTLQSSYTLAEVHVDLGCTPIGTCAPGQYTYGNTNAAVLGSTFTVPGLTLPTCSNGSQLFLIIHAVIRQTATGTTCPPVVT